MKKKDDLRQVLAFLNEEELAEQTEEAGDDPAEEEQHTGDRKRKSDGRPDRRFKKDALRSKATVLMRAEQLEALEDLAGRQDMSVNQLINAAIIKYLEAEGYPGGVLRSIFSDQEEGTNEK